MARSATFGLRRDKVIDRERSAGVCTMKAVNASRCTALRQSRAVRAACLKAQRQVRFALCVVLRAIVGLVKVARLRWLFYRRPDYCTLCAKPQGGFQRIGVWVSCGGLAVDRPATPGSPRGGRSVPGHEAHDAAGGIRVPRGGTDAAGGPGDGTFGEPPHA